MDVDSILLSYLSLYFSEKVVQYINYTKNSD